MSNSPDFREWVGYEPLWLVIGCILMVMLVLWYGAVFYLTRRKPPRTIATLPLKAYVPPDLTALKAKYVQLILEVEGRYAAKTLSAREVHQKLSYLLRMFVFEIRGHRVDTLTLDDLKKTRYTELTAAIESYYLPEFTAVERGSVADAIALARKVVTEWN